jgi:uroporphyrinogen decarboxylase
LSGNKLNLADFKLSVNYIHVSEFIKACWGEEVKVKPVWFIAQSGRYIREFAEIVGNDFFKAVRDPLISSKLTLLPKKLGIDALILFQDIVTPLMAYNIDFYFDNGPKVKGEVSLDGLKYDINSLKFVLEEIKFVKSRKGNLPLIGFSGGPFSLLYYLNGKDLERVVGILKRREILEDLINLIIDYYKLQLRGGIDSFMLFDTNLYLLMERDLDVFKVYLSKIKEVFNEISLYGIPSIFFMLKSLRAIDYIKNLGFDVLTASEETDIVTFKKLFGKSVQGNLDPKYFLKREDLEREVIKILNMSKGMRGHIFNVTHRVPVGAREEDVMKVVKLVHEVG